ncbi:hypothetical protein B0H21DRAFT_813538 [Amylocystis lapponica]|nr:hypothetical protein B0H21DRAFT_813538 [Amylocystis lapponica]
MAGHAQATACQSACSSPEARSATSDGVPYDSTPCMTSNSVPLHSGVDTLHMDEEPHSVILTFGDAPQQREPIPRAFTLLFQYLLDVHLVALRLLRAPLGLIICLYVLAVVSYYATMALCSTSGFSLICTVSAICQLPGFSLLCPPSGGAIPPQSADFPGIVDMQGAVFEQLLDNSVAGSSLSLQIKKAQMAVSDLVTLVRVSDLSSKALIAESLEGFVGDAKRTSRGLQRLSAKIGGAVDSIMAVNDYALHKIEAADHIRSASLIPVWPRSRPSAEKILPQVFEQAMDVLSAHVQRVILEAEVSFSRLDMLEQRLATLHEHLSREEASITSAKNELLSDLWTRLGGNRRELRSFEGHLEVLGNLADYRVRALAHVVSTLHKLQGLSGDLEDLRERVAAPELTGPGISVEVHMRSIRNGLERLRAVKAHGERREREAQQSILEIDATE